MILTVQNAGSDRDYKENYPRLQRAKAEWDPHDIFNHKPSIRAAVRPGSPRPDGCRNSPEGVGWPWRWVSVSQPDLRASDLRISQPSSAWHRWVDHTSEVQLQVGGGSFAELAAEAGRALADLLLRGAPAAPEGEPRTLEVGSHDREALLVDWLNEILYIAETGLWIPVEFEMLEASATHLAARARGVSVDLPPSLVKAATFHGLRVEEGADGLRAEVIFDV